MTIPHVIEHLTTTAESRAKVFGPQDSSALLALHMAEAVKKLHTAASRTLEENLHLADGDKCTLIHLKRALAE